MNREQQIEKAQYFRIGARVIDIYANKSEVFLVHQKLSSKGSSFKIESISAAKRFTRNCRNVVAQKPGENLAKIAIEMFKRAEAAKAEEEARIKAEEEAKAAAEAAEAAKESE